MNRIQSVEMLRGLAAISVMCFHFSIGRDIPVFSAVFAHGHIGVDLFFLISGFVIYVSTEKDRHPVRFLIRRGFRIFPLAWVCAAVAYAVMPRFAPINVLADLLLMPANTYSDPPIYAFHILPVLWSLSYELVFYAVFALALAAGRMRGVVAAMVLIGLVMAGQGTIFITIDAQSSTLLGRPFFANPMMLYFPIGMMTGFLFLRGWRPNWMALAILAGLTAGGWWALPPAYGLTRIGLVTLPLFVLMLRVDGGRIGAALGAITYAVYLIHPLIAPAIGEISIPAGLAFGATPQWAQVAILISLTMALATLAHFLIERPFIRFGRSLIGIWGLRNATIAIGICRDVNNAAGHG